jgi:hypothetical protein
MAQAVSSRRLATEALVRSWDSSCWFVALEQVSIRVFHFACQYHSTVVLHRHVSSGIRTRSVRVCGSEA